MRITALRRRFPHTLQKESSGEMGEPHSGQYEPAPGSSSTFLKTPKVASPGKHRNSSSTAIRGLRITPPTSAAVTTQRQKTGSAPVSSDMP